MSEICLELNMIRKSNTFTLVELLVVIAIISMLAGIMLPALSRARAKGQESTCLNNLKQINLLISSYEIDYSGIYPYAVNAPPWGASEGWMNLISKSNGDRYSFICPNERVRQFSYSLNCVRIYNNTLTYGSWNAVELTRGSTSPSSFILVEESDSDMFSVTDSDHDNYTQGACRFMEPEPKHKKSGAPMLYLDGHAKVEKRFDISRMSYFTDEMAEWHQ